jgi:hypothetical protein
MPDVRIGEFDDRENAERLVEELETLGVRDDAIEIEE